MLEKKYNIAEIEEHIYSLWEKTDSFKAYDSPQESENSFSIMLPPPNLTGSLHMGHALDITVQDILARFMRMRGKNVLWQPGLDHAGIATQMVVERHLTQLKEPSRIELGREEFVSRTWKWCGEYGGIITNQMRRLGASCDWSRERFTLDEGLSKAVLEVFVTLYREGLIYKDKRLVNWDVKLLTAISDIETVPKEVKGKLYYIRYMIEDTVFNADDKETFITIATTRPETLFGDTAIAVHPEDARFKNLVGKYAIIPLVGRKIKIVADEYVDIATGTGALKVTPAHDFNDFEIGRRHKLEVINILTENGQISLGTNKAYLSNLPQHLAQNTIDKFDKLDRFKARDTLVELLEQHNYLDKIEAYIHMVPHGDRSGLPVEPFLTDQWYVNAAILAKPAIEAVEKGEINIVPTSWKKTYYQWLQNIQPWCISRQLWWGHQIPAWYGPDKHIFVEKTEKAAKEAALKHYGKEVELIRDADVLDTWFSSGLWPFSTLGWPEQTDALKTFYPTNYLVTGFDLVFYWVSRMIMLGIHFTKQVPFKNVYFHALVRDKTGAKMSKSKGNVIDPLDLINEYGADALRFTLATMLTQQGRDIRLDPSRIAGYRNFSTKLWNATRFAQMNEAIFYGEEYDNFNSINVQLETNCWILHELSAVQSDVEKAIFDNRFNDAANAMYKFIWSHFCDWYIELSKPTFSQSEYKKETQLCIGYCLRHIYKLLHPFMPYITEELWQKTSMNKEASPLAKEKLQPLSYSNEKAYNSINFIINLITEIRSIRMQMGVIPSAYTPLCITKVSDFVLEKIDMHRSIIKKLARINDIKNLNTRPSQSIQVIINDSIFYLEVGNVIDIPKEKNRLEKELTKISNELLQLEVKLQNKNFLEKASQDIIEKDKARQAELCSIQEKITNALRDMRS